jgi:hypothetical protein
MAVRNTADEEFAAVCFVEKMRALPKQMLNFET